jgi:hypothetical protein
VGQIDIRALTGTTTNDVHGVEIAPGHPDILYVTSRNTPVGDNMELVVDVSGAPKLLGSVNGLATSACGVYAIANKADYVGTMPSGMSLSLNSGVHPGGIYWDSYADYTNHILSVDLNISNSGAAALVNITSATATNGVTLSTPTPKSVGIIATSGVGPVTLQYDVGAATFFQTTVHASAQNGSQIASW